MSTVLEDNENVFNALCVGATGYLVKSALPEQVVRAIHEIHSGGSPMSMNIARMVVESVPRKKNNQALLESLTKRERVVLDHLAAGYRCECFVGIQACGPRLEPFINASEFQHRNFHYHA